MKIITLEQLQAYCEKYNLSHYSSTANDNAMVVIQIPGEFKEQETLKFSDGEMTGLLPVTLQSCHIYENRNGSYISKAVMKKAMPSFSNRPILGHIIQKEDGAYYGFVYDGEGDGFLIQPLDPAFCKITAQSSSGEYIYAFDATFFDKGNNKDYLYGTGEDTEGIWDSIFVDGYETYKNQGVDYRWFEIPVERSICIISGNDPDMPLPYFLPIFISLLDLLDLEQILASKAELENYVLLVSKIPLLGNATTPDEFAVSLEIVQAMQELIDSVVPSLVGTAYSPCDLDVVHFDQSNKAEDTNKLAESMHNLFSNLGMSELVVSGGTSTNSVGLKHSIQNDESIAFSFMESLESWMNSYIRLNYSDQFIFYFHRTTYFSQEIFVNQTKDAATLGLPVGIDYATGLGYTPYEVMCNTYLEQALGIKDGLWKPLSTSYTESANNKSSGAPEKDEGDLSPEGIKTKEGDKNAGTKASK